MAPFTSPGREPCRFPLRGGLAHFTPGAKGPSKAGCSRAAQFYFGVRTTTRTFLVGPGLLKAMPHSGLLLALAEGLKRHADADAADLRETWLCEVWQMRWRRMVWGKAVSGA